MKHTLNTGCTLTYRVRRETSFLFQVAVAQTPCQQIQQDRLVLSRGGEPEACRVGLMGARMHRALISPGDLQVDYRATVVLEAATRPPGGLFEVSHAQLPGDVLPFLNPSRYCESDRLLKLAWDLFGNTEPGHARVAHLVDWTHDALAYTPGSTHASTTACDVLLSREGVCRDYAHVAIALCRALGIPARYVAGYAAKLEPPDFHGFFEAYLGRDSDTASGEGDWYLFDATRLAPVTGFARIGTGRDAADTSFAAIVGSAQSTGVTVWANPVGGEIEASGGRAVSSA